MATLVLLMSVLAIVGDSLPVACVAPHRASPSLRLAESAMEMFGAADYSLDLELRETAVDATTAGAGARCGAPPPFGVLTSQLTMKSEWSTSGGMLLSPPSVEGGRAIHGNVSELLISRRERRAASRVSRHAPARVARLNRRATRRRAALLARRGLRPRRPRAAALQTSSEAGCEPASAFFAQLFRRGDRRRRFLSS